MTRHDWLLLVLAAAEGDALSPLQLQKSLFLVGHGLAGLVSTDFYDFQPHAYGPFAASIYHDAEDQQLQGFVAIRPHPRTKREFSLTPAGSNQVKMLVAELHTDAVRYYCEIVQWVQSQAFQELTQAVYEQFPAFAKRSVMPGARFTALAAEEPDPVKKKIYANQPFMAAIEKALREEADGTDYILNLDDLGVRQDVSPRAGCTS
jgi:hypothetical protein